MPRSISHDAYLRRMVSSAKNELELMAIEHKVNVSTYEAKRKMLQSQIDSIEQQLDAHKSVEEEPIVYRGPEDDSEKTGGFRR